MRTRNGLSWVEASKLGIIRSLQIREEKRKLLIEE
jgi:hypothetical protein